MHIVGKCTIWCLMSSKRKKKKYLGNDSRAIFQYYQNTMSLRWSKTARRNLHLCQLLDYINVFTQLIYYFYILYVFLATNLCNNKVVKWEKTVPNKLNYIWKYEPISCWLSMKLEKRLFCICAQGKLSTSNNGWWIHLSGILTVEVIMSKTFNVWLNNQLIFYLFVPFSVMLWDKGLLCVKMLWVR